MDAAQINSLLIESLCDTSTRYLGVFALDQLPPTLTNFPCCYVANTDPISLPGTHWVAFYLDSRTHLEFFDSYGNSPDLYNFPTPPKLTSIICNDYPFQKIQTSVCGQYCIFYLHQRAHHIPLRSIISSLRSFPDPDSYVRSFVSKLRSKFTNCINHPCSNNQCARMKQ